MVLAANPDMRELRRYNREPWPWCGKGHAVTRHRVTSGRSAFICAQCWCETLFDGHTVVAWKEQR